MTARSDGLPTKALLLIGVFEKLRRRDGLTVARIHAGRVNETTPLLELASTRFGNVRDRELAAAAFDLVVSTVRDQLHGTQQIVADAMLALGLHERTYENAGIDARTTHALYHAALGRRRLVLLNSWTRLHDALDLAAPEAPGDRALRGTTEPEVLRELARQLVRPDGHSGGSRTVTTRPTTPTDATPPVRQVVVVGGAVMDATFRIKSLPAPETSSEAYDFSLSPGGKALTQAIACARLGLKSSLIAAVADDRFGDDILEHLDSEGVDTSLIKRVHGASTPFTGVFERELGDSIAVNWRNQREVFLSQQDMEDRADDLVGCDVLMTTFEMPRVTMERTLTLAHREPENRAVVIVTPGQPYIDERISPSTFGRIDYLVAHPWELGPFAPAEVPFAPGPVAEKLVTFGVDTLCLLVNGGCTIYSHPLEEATPVPLFPPIYKETSVARDAFCAGLAAKLIDDNRTFSPEVAIWASAAMSCAASGFRSESMPDRKQIDTFLARSGLRPQHPAAV
jgi:ribokinase